MHTHHAARHVARHITMAQALVGFLKNQYVERDGVENRFFEGVWGIFGHGIIAGLGQALQQNPDFPYYLCRNEQGAVHIATAFAKARKRKSAFVCTSSIGPGATNMITGAATATVNRIPVLLLPGDIFARRNVAPVLQQIESEHTQDISANDAFKPVSRYWDRIYRPDQLICSLPEAMRVLTSPAQTGAVTLALPQDVQAEAGDYPEELFQKRVWHIPRAEPEGALLKRAAEWIRAARSPIIVAGGGAIYSEASDALARFAEQTGIPVGETQAGKGSLPFDHPQNLGAIGWAIVAMTVTILVCDARTGLERLADAVEGYRVDTRYAQSIAAWKARWEEETDRIFGLRHGPPISQGEVIGAVSRAARPHDTVLNAAGSLPGDLHKLWRTRWPGGYHMEYGNSCMGYEIAGGLGAKMADPSRDVYVMVGDASYLMMSSEIITSIQEGYKLCIVILDNHGFSSIGGLSRAIGSGGFGTDYRYRGAGSGQLDGDYLPVDFVKLAEGLGAIAVRAATREEVEQALEAMRGHGRTSVVVVEVDKEMRVPGYESWWDVQISEVSEIASVRRARAEYEAAAAKERHHEIAAPAEYVEHKVT